EAKAIDGALFQRERETGFPTQTETRGESWRHFPDILAITKNVRFTIAPACFRAFIERGHVSGQKVRLGQACDGTIEGVCPERRSVRVVIFPPVRDDSTKCQLMVAFHDIDFIRHLIRRRPERRIAEGAIPYSKRPVN